MGSLGPVHWIIVLAVIALFAIPVSKILRKAGYSGWWTILAFIPGVSMIFLWVFAFSTWPRDQA
jgi:uncharacterized membrane protein YhaH (DUF805 family)